MPSRASRFAVACLLIGWTAACGGCGLAPATYGAAMVGALVVQAVGLLAGAGLALAAPPASRKRAALLGLPLGLVTIVEAAVLAVLRWG